MFRNVMYCEIYCCLHVNNVVNKHFNTEVHIEPLKRCAQSFRYIPTKVFEILETHVNLISCCVCCCLQNFNMQVMGSVL